MRDAQHLSYFRAFSLFQLTLSSKRENRRITWQGPLAVMHNQRANCYRYRTERTNLSGTPKKLRLRRLLPKCIDRGSVSTTQKTNNHFRVPEALAGIRTSGCSH